MRYICFFIFIFDLLLAQPAKIDSLKQKISHYQNQAEKHVRKNNDSLLYYGGLATDIADQMKDSNHRDRYYQIGWYYQRSGLYDSASAELQKALELYIQTQDSTGIGKTKNQLGHIYRLKAEYMQAKQYFEDAIDIHKKYGNKKELGKALTNLANLYTKWADYKKAIDLLLEAGNNYQQIDFAEGFAWLDFSMSMLYQKVGEYDQALNYVKNSLETYKKLQDSIGIRLCYNQMGYLYTYNFDSLAKGLEYQKKTLELAQKLDLKAITADGLIGVGKTYYKLGKYEQSKEYLQRANQYKLETGLIPGLASNYKYLGYIAAHKKNYDQAIKYYNEAQSYANQLNNKSIQRDIYWAFFELHEQRGEFRKALENLKNYIHLDDQILSNEVAKKVASTQLKHEIEQKEKENQFLEQQYQIQKLKATRANLSRNILIISILFILIVLIALIYLYIKQKQIKTLQELIPICANCKKIRNDKGYYQDLENYISEHTNSNFSHGICPECLKELYPDTYKKMQDKKNS